ncbi:VOC family protein [Amycolatopsis jejuensis]|uniref:VOC family protein n=1 Tax=Amycolatopsis jejuensis TaxID=330084 RepID=UPI00052575F4|nr:VOC family protein [Amycolatopsis jejuensis]
MFLTSLDHYNIETADLGGTISFYRDVLGMTLGDRPALDVKGAWLCIGGHAVVHVNEVGEDRAARTGPIDHVAFEAQDFDGLRARLDELGIPYDTVDSRPRLPLRQVYLFDPSKIRLELNFRGA